MFFFRTGRVAFDAMGDRLFAEYKVNNRFMIIDGQSDAKLHPTLKGIFGCLILFFAVSLILEVDNKPNFLK